MKTVKIVDIKTKQVQVTLSAPGAFITEPNVNLFNDRGVCVGTFRIQPGFEGREVGSDPAAPNPVKVEPLEARRMVKPGDEPLA